MNALIEINTPYLSTFTESLDKLRLENGSEAIKEGDFYSLLDGSIGSILRQKQIPGEGIQLFLRSFREHVEEEKFEDTFKQVILSPLSLKEHLNKRQYITKVCNQYKISNSNNWIGKFKFPGSTGIGRMEAFLILLYDGCTASSKGDVKYFDKHIEVKFTGGNFRGQKGYRNALRNFITELIKKEGLTVPLFLYSGKSDRP